jgi:hypothetical protein
MMRIILSPGEGQGEKQRNCQSRIKAFVGWEQGRVHCSGQLLPVLGQKRESYKEQTCTWEEASRDARN